jgi:predicted dehydrogenase
MERIGFGLIGLGSISRAHIRGYQAVSDRAQIVAVCDINRSVVEERAAELGAKAYTDYRELLQHPDVNAVDIILPHNLHHSTVAEALSHRKHVIVEKPLAIRADQGLELIELAQTLGLTLTVAENTRFVTAYQEAARIIQTGSLGQPRLVRTLIYGSEVHRLKNISSWKGRIAGSGGGVIIDAAPHSFYLLHWLFGEIETVQAVQARLVAESEVEDHALVTGRLKNGTLYSTEYTFTAEIPWGERLEVYGSEGTLIVDQLNNPPAIHYQGSTDYAGTPLKGVSYAPADWKLFSIAEGVKDFVNAIWENRPPAVDPRDGYYILKLIEIAYASAGSGKALFV